MSHPIALPQPTVPAMPHSAAQPPQPIAPGMRGAQSQAGAAAVDVAPLGAPISALPFPSTDSVAGCMHAAGASGLSGTIQAGPLFTAAHSGTRTDAGQHYRRLALSLSSLAERLRKAKQSAANST
jgi:hypothetical protein